MYPSDAPILTHRALEDNATFQEMMAERLKQSPWILLSAAAHAVLLVLIWALTPPEQPKAHKVKVQIADNHKEQVVLPPEIKPPEMQPEVDPDIDPIEDFTAPENDADLIAEASDDRHPTESSFPHDQWNAAVGINGGAGGPLYSGRQGVGGGGGRNTSPYVGPGLQWLAAHQDDDGRWDADGFMKHDDPTAALCTGPGNAVHDVGVTALALLAFLGENNTMSSGKYRGNVKRSVMWLRSQQDQETGLIGGRASHDYIYDHAIAAYALCEAFGLSESKLLKKCAQRGINYLESHRNGYSVWRYQPQDQDNDISVTGWAIMAYKSGKFFGLEVNDQALKLAGGYLDDITDQTGMHGYQKAGQRSSRKPGEHGIKFPTEKSQALTAVGLFSRFFLGQDPDEQSIMNASANLLTSTLPVWDESDGSIDHYYWYYATYALFQMGGSPWKKWQKALTQAVGQNQHAKKSEQNLYGSWDPVGAWGEDGGRVYSTAILTLTMQANYRYTRLIR